MEGVSIERAWVLLPEGGPSFGDRLEGPALVAALGEALASASRSSTQAIARRSQLSDDQTATPCSNCSPLTSLPR